MARKGAPRCAFWSITTSKRQGRNTAVSYRGDFRTRHFEQDDTFEVNYLASHWNVFEAGTPAIGEAIGLGAVIDYLSETGMEKIHDYETELASYLYESLQPVQGVRIYSPKTSRGRAALCSSNVENMHPTDIATFLDQRHGVATRTGHHCAQPLHQHLGVNANVRASLYFYNTKEDVNYFIGALKDTIGFFNSFK